MSRVFSIEEYKKHGALVDLSLEIGWPQDCDGVTAEDGWMTGRDGRRYHCDPSWAIETSDAEPAGEVPPDA